MGTNAHHQIDTMVRWTNRGRKYKQVGANTHWGAQTHRGNGHTGGDGNTEGLELYKDNKPSTHN